MKTSKFIHDSWEYLYDRVVCNKLYAFIIFASSIANGLIIAFIATYFITWEMPDNYTVYRLFLVLTVVSILPYIVYYKYLKEDKETNR